MPVYARACLDIPQAINTSTTSDDQYELRMLDEDEDDNGFGIV